MDRSDKVNIVTGLVNSYIRKDNVILSDISGRLLRENERLKKELEDLKNENMQLQMEQDLYDNVAREYFVNNEEARVRWEGYLAYEEDELFLNALNVRELFGTPADFTPMLRLEDLNASDLTDDDIEMMYNM